MILRHISLGAGLSRTDTAVREWVGLLAYWAAGKTAELFAAACEVGPTIANRPKAEQTACRSVGMNLGIAFQLVDDVLDYGGKSAKLGKNIGDDFREGKITLPVVLAFRRGNDTERAFWVRALERGEINDRDLDHAIALMTKHRALEDTITRAEHYGAMAVDALALFPASPMKTALEQKVYSGRASDTEIALLIATCKELGDKMCVAQARQIKAQRQAQ